MTVSAFLQDFLKGGVERDWFGELYRSDMRYIVAMTAIVVIIVALAERRGVLSAFLAILGLAWFATPFGFAKVAIAKADLKPVGSELGKIALAKLETFPELFVPSTFVIELLLTTLLVWMVHNRQRLPLNAETLHQRLETFLGPSIQEQPEKELSPNQR